MNLRRLEGDGDSVEYGGDVVTPSETYALTVRITVADGIVTLTTNGEDPPVWLLEMVRTTLRSAWHAHRAGVSWPRRLTRWREAPEAN
jgi:hypothetical protein